MGLKFIIIWEVHIRSLVLKSDQNGIEIIYHLFIFLYIKKLKSDQNGIEIIIGFMIGILYAELKSDQNGIEIHRVDSDQEDTG